MLEVMHQLEQDRGGQRGNPLGRLRGQGRQIRLLRRERQRGTVPTTNPDPRHLLTPVNALDFAVCADLTARWVEHFNQLVQKSNIRCFINGS